MNVRKLTQCGIFAAATCLCAWLSFPLFGVPVTLQSFALALTLLTLGGKGGCLSIFVYLCLGAVGLPVFSGFGGGIGILTGPTGGYLWGFLLGGLVYWLVTALGGKKIPAILLFQGVCYLCGMVWFAIHFAPDSSLWEIFVATVLPFLLPDGIKLTLALTLSNRLSRHIS